MKGTSSLDSDVPICVSDMHFVEKGIFFSSNLSLIACVLRAARAVPSPARGTSAAGRSGFKRIGGPSRDG